MAPLISTLRRSRSLQVALLTLGTLASTSVYLAHAQVSAAVATSSPEAPALPSGLSPVSHLVVEGSQLAIDSNGTLFRSDDKGKHWHPVKQQWDGKAVELLGIPALTAAPGSGQAPKVGRGSNHVCRCAVEEYNCVALGQPGPGKDVGALHPGRCKAQRHQVVRPVKGSAALYQQNSVLLLCIRARLQSCHQKPKRSGL